MNSYDHESDPDPLVAGDDQRVDERGAGISAWGVSILGHALILMVVGTIVVVGSIITDPVPVALVALDEPPPEPENTRTAVIERPQQQEIEVEPEVEDVVLITDLELIDEVEAETEDEHPDEGAKGLPSNISDSAMASTCAFQAIGVSSGAKGVFSIRIGRGRQRRSASIHGAPSGTTDAVHACLRWFATHQSPNGQWDVDAYPVNCALDGGRCEPGTAHTGSDGDIACTGYALLCFLGAGYDHRHLSTWRRTVKGGVDWLLAQQADGLFGRRNYEHAIATLALAEAYALSEDHALRDPVEQAVAVILARQAQDDGYGLGWDYVQPKRTRLDSSVTGWNVMALKAAKAAGIGRATAGLEGARRWLDGAWRAANPGWEKLDPYGESVFPYTWNAETDAVDMHDGDLTCVGALCAVFLGQRAGETMLDSMNRHALVHQKPTAWPTDSYYLYYNTLALFMAGGDGWQQWTTEVMPLLVAAQRQEAGCYRGSWDPQDAGGHKVAQVGRLLVTAYTCLSLEVYWRYVRDDPMRTDENEELRRRL